MDELRYRPFFYRLAFSSANTDQQLNGRALLRIDQVQSRRVTDVFVSTSRTTRFSSGSVIVPRADALSADQGQGQDRDLRPVTFARFRQTRRPLLIVITLDFDVV